MFGFASEKKNVSQSMGTMKSRRTSLAKVSQAVPTPSPSMMMKPVANSTTMTTNGMYNTMAIRPPPPGQKPTRRATGGSVTSQPVNFMPPSVQPALQPQPVGHQPVGHQPVSNQPVGHQPIGRQSRQVNGHQGHQGHSNGHQDFNGGSHDNTQSTDTIVSDLAAKIAGFKQSQQQASQGQGTHVAAPSSPVDEQYKVEINRTIDSLRKDLVSLAQRVSTPQLDNVGTEQQLQKFSFVLNEFKGQVDNLQTVQRAIQLQLNEYVKERADNSESVLSPDALDQAIDGLSQDVYAKFDRLKADIKESLQSISDRMYFCYATVLVDELTCYSEPSLKSIPKWSARLPKGARVLLTYPMNDTGEGMWIRIRTITDFGQFENAWVPLWTFTLEALEKYKGITPPQSESKIYYLGNLTVTP